MDDLQKDEKLMHKQYEKAYLEWEGRIGSAKIQARNWRLAALVSILVIILLLISIIMVISSQERYVYVAEVKPGEHVSNIQRVETKITPNKAQQITLIGRFLENVFNIPLDPVVLRKNWIAAFEVVGGQAVGQLNKLMQQEKPFMQVGKIVQSATIESVTQVSDHSFDVTWATKTIDRTGKTISIKLYSGVFTLFKGKSPESLTQLFINPTSMQIGYFSFNEKGSSQ